MVLLDFHFIQIFAQLYLYSASSWLLQQICIRVNEIIGCLSIDVILTIQSHHVQFQKVLGTLTSSHMPIRKMMRISTT